MSAHAKDSVLFICPHGAAKSVIAAAYFNRLAAEHGMDHVASAAAAEDPYPSVPPAVARFLEQEGFGAAAFTPRQADERDLLAAVNVVSIGCDLTGSTFAGVNVEQWDDVPLASEHLVGSAAAIRQHVETLVERLRGHR